MKISLIIPVHNKEKYIGDCLLSIQKYGKELFEIIVVNNASTDRTALIVKSFPNVRLINETRKGLVFARNKGLKEAKGDLVAFIEATTKIPKNWVKKIVKEFKKKSIVSISGPYMYYNNPLLKKIMTWIYWIFIGWPIYLLIGYKTTLGNFVARKSALEKVGGFDENIHLYEDDNNISKKLHKIGKTKFIQTFYIFHQQKD